MSHDWHLFDIERGYEVRRVGDVFEVRRQSNPDNIVTLNEREFEELRGEGPNPKGL